jgi:hypothetical protein
MGNWLFYVETNCTEPSRENEFNHWYDVEHMPEVMKGCPEFLRYKRYKLIAGESGSSYLVVIEIETDDIEQTMSKHQKNSARLRAIGQWSDLVQVVSRKLYKLEKEL